MKHYTIVRFGYSDSLVIPLEKAAALLELINSPTNRFEASYNYSDDEEDANRGSSLVPRGNTLEIQVVNESELIALQNRGIAELKNREKRNVERRENERLQAEAKAERVDIEADQEAVNPY